MDESFNVLRVNCGMYFPFPPQLLIHSLTKNYGNNKTF